MSNDLLNYLQLCGLCDQELAAADQADGKRALIEHLEQALRFAQRASARRGGSPRLEHTFSRQHASVGAVTR